METCETDRSKEDGEGKIDDGGGSGAEGGEDEDSSRIDFFGESPPSIPWKYESPEPEIIPVDPADRPAKKQKRRIINTRR